MDQKFGEFELFFQVVYVVVLDFRNCVDDFEDLFVLHLDGKKQQRQTDEVANEENDQNHNDENSQRDHRIVVNFFDRRVD